MRCRHSHNEENMKKFCETGSFIPVRTKLLEGGVEYKTFKDEMKILNDIVGTIDPKMASDETSVAFQQLNEVFNEEMDPLAVNNSVTAEEVAANCQERMSGSIRGTVKLQKHISKDF